MFSRGYRDRCLLVLRVTCEMPLPCFTFLSAVLVCCVRHDDTNYVGISLNLLCGWNSTSVGSNLTLIRGSYCAKSLWYSSCFSLDAWPLYFHSCLQMIWFHSHAPLQQFRLGAEGTIITIFRMMEDSNLLNLSACVLWYLHTKPAAGPACGLAVSKIWVKVLQCCGQTPRHLRPTMPLCH